MTHCNTQLSFPFFKGAKLTAAFDGGSIVSDGGLLLLREFDDQIRMTDSIADLVYDPRDYRFVQHSQTELIRQRLFQIIAGYEDANDASRLRHDALFKLLSGRTPEQDPLGSQPTLCRLENRVGDDTISELVENMVRTFIRTRPEPLTEITLDIDPSESRTYGQQELTFYNGHYNSHMYFPQFICDAKSRLLVAAVLRPGNAPAFQSATSLLARIVELLRAEWPQIRISVRGDSGFCDPALLNWLEEEGITYAIGMSANTVLQSLSKPFVESVEARYRATSEPQRSFTSVTYQTRQTWLRPRRLLVKVEVTAMGTNVRFVIVTRAGRSRALYDWYVQRGGTVEDAIEQLKNGFEGDRLSCRRFEANAFRLMLHCAAYNLVAMFRERIPVPELRDADIQTFRIKLIKVGARVERTVRRVWVRLSSTWPFASLFTRTHASLFPWPGG